MNLLNFNLNYLCHNLSIKEIEGQTFTKIRFSKNLSYIELVNFRKYIFGLLAISFPYYEETYLTIYKCIVSFIKLILIPAEENQINLSTLHFQSQILFEISMFVTPKNINDSEQYMTDFEIAINNASVLKELNDKLPEKLEFSCKAHYQDESNLLIISMVISKKDLRKNYKIAGNISELKSYNFY